MNECPVGGRHPPPMSLHHLLLLRLLRLLFRHSSRHLLPCDDDRAIAGALLSAPSSSSSRPSSSSGLVTSFRLQRSVAHRLAPKVLGLFPAPALVVHEIGVQLRERHDLEAPLLEQTREYPLVVGREQVDRAVALRRAEPEARRDRRRVALQ